MRRGALLALGVLLIVVALGWGWAAHARQLSAGRYGRVQVVEPPVAPRGLVIYFADPALPRAQRRQFAGQLAHAGAWVAVVDAARYRQRLQKGNGSCRAMADDAALLAQKLLKRERAEQFYLPVLVGQGSSAGLVRDSAAGAAAGEFAAALVAADGAAASDAGCVGGTATVQVKSLPTDALLAAVPAALHAAPASGVATLPLVEMPVAGSKRLVVLVSGDGGWRDLDKGLAHELNQRGISVVGWNSLRYFWKKRTAAQIGADLDNVMRTYRQRWQADDVALVGYSFGADVLPFAYPLLSGEQRRAVRLVSLLGLAHGADFEVRVGGWLGWFRAQEVPVQPALAGLQPVAHQCIYGVDEKDSLCRDLRGDAHMQVVELPGGHHFDRDPGKLARIIVDRWDAAPAQP